VDPSIEKGVDPKSECPTDERHVDPKRGKESKRRKGKEGVIVYGGRRRDSHLGLVQYLLVC
jgi:hypothetical protein